MDHMGDGTLPDHSVVEAQIRIDLPALPLDGHVQHHPLFRLKSQSFSRRSLSSSPASSSAMKPKPPMLMPSTRNLVQGHQLGKMQDGAVPAEGNQQVGALQLRRQGPGLVVPIGAILLIP